MNLYDRRNALIKKAQDYLDDLKKSGKKNASEADLKHLDGIKAQIEELNGQIEQHEKSYQAMNGITQMFQDNGGNLGTPDFDYQKHGSELVRTVKSKGSYGFDLKHSDMVRFGTKASTITTATQNPLNTFENTNISTVPRASATSLRSLFLEQQVSNGSVRFYRLGYEGAEIVAEGGEKPLADVISEPVDASLVKLATTFKVSDELVEDAPFMVDAVVGEATRAILARENQLIVDTLSTTPGTIEVTTSEGELLDALADAVAQAEADTGLAPGALVVSPQDHAILRKARTNGSGQHLVDPFNGAPATVFGMHLFPSNALNAGEAFMLTQGAGVFYYRGPVRVETGFSGEDWQHNLLTTRVEERVLPAIIRPELITKITIGAAA